jgi:phosphatidylglycerol:prolipoprotein diacylglycerol transferase
MIWDTSPVAFAFSLGDHSINVRWYGLFFASTFVYGILIFRYMFGREGRPQDDVYDLVLYVIGGTVVGARLGHVLLYNPDYYFTHPLKIFAVWEGGLASHGAVVGILAGVWLYSRQATGQSFLWVCDRIGLAVPLSGCLIRIGNFFNSEILGTPTDLPWGVVFVRVNPLPRHPVQLYEAFSYLLIFLLQFGYYLKRGNAGPDGYLFGRFFIFVFGTRFFMEFFKEEQTLYANGSPLNLGQWLSIPAVLLGIYLVWRAKRSQGLAPTRPES